MNIITALRRMALIAIWHVLVAVGTPGNCLANDQTAIVPMTLDYALMNALVVQSSFTDTDQRAVLLHERDGCRAVTVAAPRFFEDDHELYLEIQLDLRHGVGLGRTCLFPLSFQGFLVMHKIPEIHSEDWSLRFSTESSELLTLDGKPARLANLAWGMVEDHVFGHQETISVDMGPPIKELRDFLPLVLPRDQPDLVLEMLASLRPGTVTVEPTGLRLENEIRVPGELYRKDDPDVVEEEPLTQEELERFIAAWEAWDAFLVNMIATLAGQELRVDERLLLLEVLLGLRHAFLEELDSPDPDKDLVRAQFVEVWEVLGPLFRGRLIIPHSGDLLGYLAFFSASDALLALDKLGPALGLDISRDGLLRLARLLAEGREAALEYGPEVLPDLLRILDLEDHTKVDDPAVPAPLSPWFLSLLGRLFVAPAHAESLASNAGLDRNDQWIFRRSDVHGYLSRIHGLLREQTEITLKESSMAEQQRNMFEDMVLATAWQESCFRQFIATGEQITFLRSYNNTSVGLMQINERVWRGIYDQYKLRWDIVYNARTGTKILDLYLTRYAEPRMRSKPEQDWNEDIVAGLLYAMYNGGPGQRDRFLNRLAEDNLYRSDRLFKEKWDWVRQDALHKGSICLIGH